MGITAIGGASGGISSLLLHKLQCGWWDVGNANNGILAGLVSITAGCATFEPEAGFVVGVVGGLIYFLSSNFLLKIRVSPFFLILRGFLLQFVDPSSVRFIRCGRCGSLSFGVATLSRRSCLGKGEEESRAGGGGLVEEPAYRTARFVMSL